MAFPLPSRQSRALAAAALAALALAACRRDAAETTGALYPHDTRMRHPYILTEGGRTLDVFPVGPGHLDPRQSADIDAFLLEYRRFGRGPLTLDIPRGGPPAVAAAAERTGAAIRLRAAEAGVPAGLFAVSGYAVADPGLAAPIRLGFGRMEAKVASQCGLWPQDLGVGSPGYNIRNEPTWNLGCATRSNVAAQVADPVDLVRGREEGRIDTVRRTQVIDKLRQGNDPSTTWNQDGKGGVKSEVSK